jgi:hypothetical protein
LLALIDGQVDDLAKQSALPPAPRGFDENVPPPGRFSVRQVLAKDLRRLAVVCSHSLSVTNLCRDGYVYLVVGIAPSYLQFRFQLAKVLCEQTSSHKSQMKGEWG